LIKIKQMIVVGKKVSAGSKQHLIIGKEYEVTDVIGAIIIGNGNAELKGSKKIQAPKKHK
tara:strand:+ start:49 stop:228 length:180 start_codon:yes stop_codon:yes gene_type:complete